MQRLGLWEARFVIYAFADSLHGLGREFSPPRLIFLLLFGWQHLLDPVVETKYVNIIRNKRILLAIKPSKHDDI